MSRRAACACAVIALATRAAHAACVFDANFEITNPFDPTCGGVILTYTENDNSGDDVALGYPVPVPVASLTAVDGFRTYDSLHAQHQFLMTEHATVHGEVVGETLEGRDIWAYVLGDADGVTVDGRDEPAVLVAGGIHAREWQSPEVLTEIFEQLVERADDGGFGRYLAENVNVVLVPVVNVDGFLQTQRYPANATADIEQPRDGRMRRKNLRHPSRAEPVDDDLTTVDDNFYGVDLNRNGSDGFALNGGSSGSTTSLIYRGAAPQTEPELLAVLAAADLAPRSRLRLYEDVHSFGKVYLTPQTGNTRRDTLTRALRTRMRAVTNFEYAFGDDPIGGFIGTTADYFAYELQVPSWTLELEPVDSGAEYGGTGVSHSGFVLPDSEIARVRDELALMQLLGFYSRSGPPRVQAIEVRSSADDQVVYSASWQAAADGRTLNVSVAHALVPGVEYALWLAFDRPMRWRDESGALADYPGQAVAVFPTISLEAPDIGATLALTGDASAWLTTPGGAPNGYLRYRDDALRATFSLPASFSSASSAPVVLSVIATDLALASLDADPATPVDWSDGHWTGYEDAAGDTGDEGGADCTVQLFAAEDAGANAPGTTATCAAATGTAPPPPPPDSGSGGGGGACDLALLLSLYALRRRWSSAGRST